MLCWRPVCVKSFLFALHLINAVCSHAWHDTQEPVHKSVYCTGVVGDLSMLLGGGSASSLAISDLTAGKPRTEVYWNVSCKETSFCVLCPFNSCFTLFIVDSFSVQCLCVYSVSGLSWSRDLFTAFTPPAKHTFDYRPKQLSNAQLSWREGS